MNLNKDRSETVTETFYDYPAKNMCGFLCVSGTFLCVSGTFLCVSGTFLCVSGTFNIDRTTKCIDNSESKCHGQQMVGKEKSFKEGVK
jgi:hypothetical protein